MLVKSVNKNLNIILLYKNFFKFINYFLISDVYLHIYLNNNLNNSDFIKFLSFLKYSSFLNCYQLLDIKCDDICYFSKKYRYKVTYIFLSLYYNIRIFVTCFLKENQSLNSVAPIFKSAPYLEREAWDEFGINFNFKNRHINRRLLTDYGFKGHPLKKNFPLTGFYECVYFNEKFRIKNIPISLLQEYRKFIFKN